MKIVVTGSGGQLGARLLKMWDKSGNEIIGLDVPAFDLTAPKQAEDRIVKSRPDAIVHTAAFTDVDGSEKNPGLAMAVNRFGTRAVATAARVLGAHIIYISTDYVFDGEAGRPCLETDTPNPKGQYASSKYLGENEVRDICPNHAVLRTCGLYGPTGKNFVKSIVKILREKGEAKVVDDQVVSPTYDKDLARAIDAVIRIRAIGTYHAANPGPVSWFEFAREIAKLMGLDPGVVKPISTRELDRPAPRPRFSALDSAALRAATGFSFRAWDQALTDFMTNEFPEFQG